MKSKIGNWDLDGKSVILRIDANVPMFHGTILNDQRLRASIPTIDLLLDKGAHPVLITHLDRPKTHDPYLSTKQLISWFREHGYEITYADSIAAVRQAQAEQAPLILFENVRFFSGEQNRDPVFAEQLASLGQYYINDAFGTLHRNDSSITLVPGHFDADHKSVGLLVEHELEKLDTLLSPANKPFALIIGGGKVHDKIPYISALLPHLSAIYLGPGLVFSFLKAEGKPVGRSLVDQASLGLCKDIIMHAQELGVSIHYPHDYIVAEDTYDGPLFLSEQAELASDEVGVSIGPKTAQIWAQELYACKTILINGLMGSMKRIESLTYVKELYTSIARSKATSIIAGGDSAAAAYAFGMAKEMSYISTGGGATLAYICSHTLPGLAALEDRTET